MSGGYACVLPLKLRPFPGDSICKIGKQPSKNFNTFPAAERSLLLMKWNKGGPSVQGS